MPELPGYYYDSVRNRYFKGTRPHTPSPPPKRPARAMHLVRILRNAHEHDWASSRTLITARILATSKHASVANLPSLCAFEDGESEVEDVQVEVDSDPSPMPRTNMWGPLFHSRHLSFQADMGFDRGPVDRAPSQDYFVPRHPVLASISRDVLRTSIAVNSSYGDVRVRIHSFPTGSVVAGAFYDSDPIASVWSARNCLVVYAIRSRNDQQIVWFSLPQQTLVVTRFSVRLRARISSLDISDGGYVAVGSQSWKGVEGSVSVFDRRHSLIATHSVRSPVMKAKFVDDNTIVFGTRSGHVGVFDLRTNTSRTLRMPSAEVVRLSVCCLRVEGRKVYVSSLGNGRDNLVCYDIDSTGSTPCVKYLGHKNNAKGLEFDVGGTLLASPGDDGVVRFWDKANGGEPLDMRIYMNEQPQQVKFVGYDDEKWTVKDTKVEPASTGTEENENVDEMIYVSGRQQAETMTVHENESNSKNENVNNYTGMWVVTERNLYAYLT